MKHRQVRGSCDSAVVGRLWLLLLLLSSLFASYCMGLIPGWRNCRPVANNNAERVGCVTWFGCDSGFRWRGDGDRSGRFGRWNAAKTGAKWLRGDFRGMGTERNRVADKARQEKSDELHETGD